MKKTLCILFVLLAIPIASWPIPSPPASTGSGTDWTVDQGATNINAANIPDLSGTYQPLLTNPLTQSDVDDVPVNGATTAPVSSNWAYDHENASDPHSGYLTPTELTSTLGAAYDTESELQALFAGKQASDSALTTLASKVWAASGTIGGTAGMLDAIPVASLADGDVAIVSTTGGKTQVYYYESSSAAAEADNSVVQPDDNAGNGRWLIQLWIESGVVQFASVIIPNGTSTPATCTEGSLYFETDANILWTCTATDTWTDQWAALAPTTLTLPHTNADPAAYQLRHDTTVSNHANGALRWHDNTNIRQVVDMVAATVEACTDDQVVAYDADNDLFYCKADANSGSNTSLDAIGDSAADGTIAAGGYETTITSTLDEADHSVLTIYNTDADRANDTTLITLKDNDSGDANAFFLKMISDADGTPSTFLSISSLTFLSTLAFDLGGATLEIPNSDDPDTTTTGQVSFDTDGWLRVYNNSRQEALARTQEEIHVTVYKPQDLDDAQRDHFWIWSNESGMSFIVTGWKGWSTSDDTTLTIYEEDADGANDATVDAVEIATGAGPYTGSDTTITGATIENGHLLYLDFDNTDAPAMVKITIYGYYNADVN